MKILKRIGFGLVAIIVLLLVVSLFLPSSVHVERSLVIKADEAVIFEQINNLKNWEKWSPWHKMDPKMELTYEGPASGEGAKYSWKSEELGIGSLMITNIVPNKSIKTNMNLMEGFTNSASYTFEKTAEGTKVSWVMDSEFGWNPMFKYFGLFMEGMLGKDFEAGLASLKEITEAMPAQTAEKTTYTITETDIKAQPLIGIKSKCKTNEISQVLGGSYGQLMAFAGKNKLKVTGAPMAFYHKYTPEEVELEAALPVDKVIKSSGNIISYEMKAGKAIKTKHLGKYDNMQNAYTAMDEYIKQNNKQVNGAPWEVYVTDPGMEKDTTKWVTEIYFPIK